MDRLRTRVLPIGFLLVLAAAGLLSIAPQVEAAICDGFEGFEDDANFQGPTGCWYTTSALGTTVVNTIRPYEGTKSLAAAAGGVSPKFTFNPATAACLDGTSFTASWFVNVDTLPNPSLRVGFTPETLYYFVINSAGAITIGEPGAAFFTLPTLVITPDTWYGFSLTVSCTAGAGNDGIHGTAWLASNPAGTLDGGAINGLSFTTNTGTLFGAHAATGGSQPKFWLDNIQIPAFSTIDGDQVAVTNLVGGSMDSRGQNIAIRYNNGADVATYGTTDLTQIATASTPNCNRFDGVLSATLGQGEDQKVWTTYFDCGASGDCPGGNAGCVHALRVRDYALSTPSWVNGDCDGEKTPNIVNNADIDVPNDMNQMGTIADMAFDFAECNNGGGGPGTDGAFATWTYASSPNGWIAAFGVAYVNGYIPDADTSHEENAPPLDTSTAPLTVEDFCSWTAPDGKDYIGGVSQDGAVGVYEVARSADLAFDGPSIDYTFNQKFRNAGVYAGSTAIACAGDRVAIQTPTEVRVLDDITTSNPVLLHTFPYAPVAGSRTLAMTGSSDFLAVATTGDDGMKILDLATGNLTASFDVPTGSWRSMEFDHAGQTLAIFTSSFLTVKKTADVTCELNDDCEELGSVGDDDLEGAGPGAGGGGGGGGPGTTAGSVIPCGMCWDNNNLSNAFTIMGIGVVVGGATGLMMGKKMAAVLGALGLAWAVAYTFNEGMIDLPMLLLILFITVAAAIVIAFFLDR